MYGVRMSSERALNPSRPGPRPRFTREQVLREALALIDRVGAHAFSMRALADELGIGVMTLYGYVRNKEELLEAVTNLVFADSRRDQAPGDSWDEALATIVRDLHDVFRRHPNLVALVLAQTSPSPELFKLRERMLDILCTAGFDSNAALYALGALCNYALGFGGAQAAAAPIEMPERIRELPPEEFPRLTAASDNYASHLSDQAFEFGLALLLGGLRSHLG
jgi:AcrR family transcriptional regulator